MSNVHHSLILSGRRRSMFSIQLALAMLLVLSFIVSIVIALGILSLPLSSDDADVNISSSNDQKDVVYRFAVDRDEESRERSGEQWTEVVSWEPRAFIYHNFLSKEECKHLIDIAKPHMERSKVIDKKTRSITDSSRRTSSGMFLPRGHDKVVRAIEKRIAGFTFIPIENGEELQVLHYGVGEQYKPHYDYINDELFIKQEGRRIATMIMYLSDVEEGGETVFPRAKVNSSSSPRDNELSQCGQSGLTLKPKMGNALLFWSLHPEGTLDTSALHAGCPVIRGDKWSSTKWMHTDKYNL